MRVHCRFFSSSSSFFRHLCRSAEKRKCRQTSSMYVLADFFSHIDSYCVSRLSRAFFSSSRPFFFQNSTTTKWFVVLVRSFVLFLLFFSFKQQRVEFVQHFLSTIDVSFVIEQSIFSSRVLRKKEVFRNFFNG